MKKVIFSLVFFFVLGCLSAQVIYYRTKNTNIGFGKVSDCITNPYMNFCVNGPLVGTDNLPVGGYINNNTVMKNWVNPKNSEGNFVLDNAIFGLGFDGKFYLLSYAEKDKLPKMKWAFQNGPILVRGNINIRGTSQSKYARSGVGFMKDGTLIVIVSLTPVTFCQFADLFIRKNCSNAIYLDGGPYVGCSDKNTSYGTMIDGAMKLQFFNN